jgi:hypothetical protein
MRTARSARTTLLVCLTALLALVAAPAADAAEKGLQTDITWGISGADQNRTISALEEAGTQWIRLDINWRTTERSEGVYDAGELAMTDHAMELAEHAGAKIIMAVSETPEWASGSTEVNTPPRDMADYADFVGDMAARYRGRVEGWEIWNEPNHPRFWSPGPNAAQYAQMLKAAGPAVRAADPATKVVFAGLAHNDYLYLEQVYAAEPDIGDYFDVMATHPYTQSGQSPAIVDRAPDGRMTPMSFLAFKEVRSVMVSHGDVKPFWLTEFGWSTNSQILQPLGGVSEAVQATYLGLAFSLLETTPYVEVAIVYNFRNNYWGNDADNWEDQLGLLRTDFSRKPAYTVFAALNRAAAPATQAPAAVAPAPQAPVAPAATAASAPPAAATAHVAAPEMSLKVKRLERTASRMSLRVTGRISSASDGRARIVVERQKGTRWSRVHTIRVAVRMGRFGDTLKVSRGGRWRIRATYSGGAGSAQARPVLMRG